MIPLKHILPAAALAQALACTATAQEPAPKPPKVAVEPAAPLPPRPPKPPRIHGRSVDSQYDHATRALDEGRWDDARQTFEAIANTKAPRADGALYWKAYAEMRLGRGNDALATLATLRQQYPSSDWLNDAQALTVEIQQKSGKPVDPSAEADEDIKLMAISVLINSEPDRAVPLLEKILKTPSSSPRLKDKALFVLTQNRAPQAQQLLISIAKSGSNPDLQLRALRYMAMAGNKNLGPEIAGIYSASHNQAIKKQALQSLLIAKASDELFNIARNEQDPGLRSEAIQQLGILKQSDKLAQLYQAGVAKDTVIENMFLLNDPGRLLEIIRSEKDPKLRNAAIRSLGLMHSPQAAEGLAGLYPNEQDMNTKRQIVEALFIQHNAKGLIDIARKESNLEMKKAIVEKLMMIHSKEANDYMMELLK